MIIFKKGEFVKQNRFAAIWKNALKVDNQLACTPMTLMRIGYKKIRVEHRSTLISNQKI
jgi:hypothetical protein